jgi:hypothetical protein
MTCVFLTFEGNLKMKTSKLLASLVAVFFAASTSLTIAQPAAGGAQAVEQVLPRLAVLRLAELSAVAGAPAGGAGAPEAGGDAAAALRRMARARQVARVVLEHLKLVALQNNVNVRALA